MLKIYFRRGKLAEKCGNRGHVGRPKEHLGAYTQPVIKIAGARGKDRGTGSHLRLVPHAQGAARYVHISARLHESGVNTLARQGDIAFAIGWHSPDL